MTSPEQPLSADARDELLSADIDGELDRAAAELGFTPEAARAALDASPDASARRDALMRARDLLSDPPTLDSGAEDRLVTIALARAADERLAISRSNPPRDVTALPAHRFQNAWRILVGVGTAAAVIAGVVALSASNPAGLKSSSSASKSAPTTPALGADVENGALRHSVAFGDVTAANALRAKVRAELRQPVSAPTPTTERLGSSATIAAPVLAAPKSNYGQSDSAGRQATSAYDLTTRSLVCINALERSKPVPGLQVLSGSGNAASKPVYVVVYRQAKSYVVYVLSADDCSVVSRTAVP